MAARYFAFISGLLFVLIGVAGFVPDLVRTPITDPGMAAAELNFDAGFGYLLGLFPINILHNLVHLGIGFWGLASYSKYENARAYNRGVAVFYGLLAVMGLIPVLRTSFGLIPIYSHDVWLHAITALIAGIIGFAIPSDYAGKVEERIAAGTGTHGH